MARTPHSFGAEDALIEILTEIIAHHPQPDLRGPSEKARLERAFAALMPDSLFASRKPRRGPKPSLIDDQILPLVARQIAADPENRKTSFAQKCRLAAKRVDPLMDEFELSRTVRRVRPKFRSQHRLLLSGVAQLASSQKAHFDRNIAVIVRALAELGVLKKRQKRKHVNRIINVL
jgi:hypothetical protein